MSRNLVNPGKTHTHTHTHIYIYIYICIYMRLKKWSRELNKLIDMICTRMKYEKLNF